MRLAAKTFLCLFIPLVALFIGGFWGVERAIVSTVHSRLHSVLHDHQVAIARVQLRNERQGKRNLQIVAENAALKAGIQLLMDTPKDSQARLTVEDQLRDISIAADIDLMFVSTVEGAPLAGIIRAGDELNPMDPSTLPRSDGLFRHDGVKYQIRSVPVNQSDENLAILSVGEAVDFDSLTTPTVLSYSGKVIESTLTGVPVHELEVALRACPTDAECEARVPSGNRISFAASLDLGGGYSLRRLIDLDGSLQPVHATIQRVFGIAGAIGLIGVIVLTWVSSRVIAKPITHVVRHLRESERTGTLSEFDANIGAAAEVRELMVGFNRAATAIRLGQESLHNAYVQFVQSLASALDARDPYTAGHSGRVCQFSCAIARSLGFNDEELRIIGVGALLHDIGKIGIPDSVLQKQGRLSDDEFALIQQHPTIGRRILESVNGFAPYLEVVELHHENWDGTGYPQRLAGEDVPLNARIVHVADAYDAMTSDRPYRRGMTQEVAFRILRENAGTQFDPVVVEAFGRIWHSGELTPTDSIAGFEQSLMSLANALRGQTQSVKQYVNT